MGGSSPNTPLEPTSSETEIPAEHFLTHLPKHPECEVCQGSKMTKRQCRKHEENDEISLEAKEFGDVITLDHIVTVDPEAASIAGDAYAIVIKGTATGWMECHPTATKSAEGAKIALERFVGPKDKVGDRLQRQR